MSINQQTILKAFLEAKESIPTIWFHGTPKPIERFSDDFVGQGNDQNGPGIYFTTSDEDAWSYARKGPNGVVYKVELNFRKLVPKVGKVKDSEITSLVQWADNYQDKLLNWGSEDVNEDMRLFKASLSREKTPIDVFQSIWYSFYRYQPVDFVRNMVTLGYDGFIVDRGFTNVKHAIVYNPKIIKVI